MFFHQNTELNTESQLVALCMFFSLRGLLDRSFPSLETDV